jgi:sulfatase maturation enzyme AslB (radical SAM superfamily)
MDQSNFTFTITSTDRCNVACTYCHYYSAGGKAAKRNGGTSRRLFRSDIDDDTLGGYFQFIAYFKNKYPRTNVFYRFSGGDPMVLGDRLFEMAARGYDIVGAKPYMLTAGKALNEKWVEKAKRSALSHARVSLENPLNPDPGAPNPHLVLSKIKALNSEQFPLQLGLTVVRNQDFAKLYEICDYVYQEIGILPNLAEINYDQFVVPTDQEIEDFQENIYKIFKRWLGKSRINVFAHISPEIYSDGGH